MPVEIRDRDGRPIPGATINLSGWSCSGCLLAFVCIVLGAGVLFGMLVTVLGQAVEAVMR